MRNGNASINAASVPITRPAIPLVAVPVRTACTALSDSACRRVRSSGHSCAISFHNAGDSGEAARAESFSLKRWARSPSSRSARSLASSASRFARLSSASSPLRSRVSARRWSRRSGGSVFCSSPRPASRTDSSFNGGSSERARSWAWRCVPVTSSASLRNWSVSDFSIPASAWVSTFCMLSSWVCAVSSTVSSSWATAAPTQTIHSAASNNRRRNKPWRAPQVNRNSDTGRHRTGAGNRGCRHLKAPPSIEPIAGAGGSAAAGPRPRTDRTISPHRDDGGKGPC